MVTRSDLRTKAFDQNRLSEISAKWITVWGNNFRGRSTGGSSR